MNLQEELYKVLKACPVDDLATWLRQREQVLAAYERAQQAIEGTLPPTTTQPETSCRTKRTVARPEEEKAYAPWTTEDCESLTELWNQGQKLEKIAQQLNRSVGAIYSRLCKAGLVDNATAYTYLIKTATVREELTKQLYALAQQWKEKR